MAVQQSAFSDLDGPDFVKSEEVAEIGDAVLGIHGAIGGVGRLHPVAEAVRDDELTIFWLLNTKPFNPETDDEDEPEIAGRCVKAPGLWRDVTGYHFAIWARSYFWERMDADDRRALVLHERWGVAKRGEQYAGFAQLTAGPGKEERGRQLVEQFGSVTAALRATHPDTGGETASAADFDAVMAVKKSLVPA